MNDKCDFDLHEVDSRQSSDDEAMKSRRDFLKKAGAFAIYTPPTIMLLMQPSRNAIATSTSIQSPGSSAAGKKPLS